ncbi:MAG TPA: amidohydrolase family protein [Nakamurella sp.]|nr:amidohydrolase family protein [Nakamurella sp.]
MTGLHVTGTDAGTMEPLDLWAVDGRFVPGPIGGAVELDGWVLPGFVDAHCHVGYSPHGVATLDEAEAQAVTALHTGALALRDCGSPLDTRGLVDRDDLPVLIRAGRHIARTGRYVRDLGIDLDDPDDLPAEVARQLSYGSGGWIKIVGDWIDRSIGDLAPLWPDDVLVEAIGVAHAAGARVTAHVFGEDALPGLLAAGIDCIEHGTGLTDETIRTMADGGVHLVPTLINVANFPAFADAAHRFPAYAAHMRDLHARSDETYRRASAAGVAIHAGTDSGGFIEHGRVVDEVIALGGIVAGRQALVAAGQEARRWLGLPVYELGSSADLLVYPGDPTSDWGLLRHPTAVVRHGRLVRGTDAVRLLFV